MVRDVPSYPSYCTTLQLTLRMYSTYVPYSVPPYILYILQSCHCVHTFSHFYLLTLLSVDKLNGPSSFNQCASLCSLPSSLGKKMARKKGHRGGGKTREPREPRVPRDGARNFLDPMIITDMDKTLFETIWSKLKLSEHSKLGDIH